MRVEQPRGTKEELREMFSQRVQKAVRRVHTSVAKKKEIPPTHTQHSCMKPKPETIDDRATQRAFRLTPLPPLADDAHPAADAAPRVRGFVRVALAAVVAAAVERRVLRRRGVPHAHVARARRSDRGAADRARRDHSRERRVVQVVRQRGGEGARGRGAQARRGEARGGADRVGAAEDRAVWS